MSLCVSARLRASPGVSACLRASRRRVPRETVALAGFGYTVVVMWRVLAWLGAIGGCAAAVPVAGPHADAEPPPVAEPLQAPRALSIAHPAAAYNEPVETPDPAPLAEAVRAAMRDLAGTDGEVIADPRLDLACRELAAVASRDAAPSPARVDFVLRSHGVAEPAEHVLVAWTAAVPDQVVAAMQPRLAEAVRGRVRVGVGAADGTPVIAIAVHQTGIDLVATPRAVAAHGGFELVATIDPRVWSPRLTITHEDGAVEHPAVVIDDAGRTLRAPFACGEHTGPQWIEIDATGLGGVLPRAAVPVRCGGRWPSRFAIEPPANLAGLATPADIERRLTSIINRQRARAGRPPLRTDPRLAASARLHAEAARDARVTGGAAATAPPSERLRAAGVFPQVVLESRLEVDSVAQAAEELMNQDDYRAELETPDATHVGIGVASTDGGHRFVTITYAGFLPRIDAPGVARCIIDAVETVEGSRVDTAMARAAQDYADGLARGLPREQVALRAGDDLKAVAAGRYIKIALAVISMIDVTALGPRDLTRGQPVDDLGVGVAQSPRYGAGGGVTWVVAFLGERILHARPRLDDDPEAAAHRACLAAASGRSAPR